MPYKISPLFPVLSPSGPPPTRSSLPESSSQFSPLAPHCGPLLPLTFQMPFLGVLMRCTSWPSSVSRSMPDVALSRRPTLDRKGRRRPNLCVKIAAVSVGGSPMHIRG